MTAYLIKRLLQIIPTLLGITLITFVIIQLAPGNPAMLKLQMGKGEGTLGEKAFSEQIIQQTKELYGLDKPLPVQYLLWVKRIFTLDFGFSYKDHRNVWEKISERLPITIQLNIISIFLVYLIAIPCGIYSSTHDRVGYGQDSDGRVLFPLLASEFLGRNAAHNVPRRWGFLGHFPGLRHIVDRERIDETAAVAAGPDVAPCASGCLSYLRRACLPFETDEGQYARGHPGRLCQDCQGKRTERTCGDLQTRISQCFASAYNAFRLSVAFHVRRKRNH